MNKQSFLLFEQIASSHQFADFLLARINRIYQICMSNHCLNESLMRLLNNSTFNQRTGRFKLNKLKCKQDIKNLNQFFDYLYFASDSFLKKAI